MPDPLTLRYNNPGAVEYRPWMAKYGARLGPNGRYAEFGTPDQGYQVMGRVLDTYAKRGQNSVASIIGGLPSSPHLAWAGRNVDGNSTDLYIKKVADELGVGPDDVLTPAHRQSLMQAMARYEAGRAPAQIAGVAPTPPQMSLGGPQERTAPAMAQRDASGLGLLSRFADGVQDVMMSPLFQSGAAMVNAGSQGLNPGAGFVQGTEAAGKARGNMLALENARREMGAKRLRDQLWHSLSQGETPAWAQGLPPEMIDLARSLGPDAGWKLITDLTLKNAEKGIERDRLAETRRYHDILAKQAEAQLLESQAMNAERMVLMRGQADLNQQKIADAAAREARRRQLLGLPPTPPPAGPQVQLAPPSAPAQVAPPPARIVPAPQIQTATPAPAALAAPQTLPAVPPPMPGQAFQVVPPTVPGVPAPVPASPPLRQLAPPMRVGPPPRVQPEPDASPDDDPDPELQLQSDNGESPPELVRTQAASTPPAVQDPRRQGLIQTPRGWMPPAEAQTYAQQLMTEPEYRALGQSILKDIDRNKDASGLDKGAKAEVEKAMVSNVNLVGRLNAITEGFSRDEIGEFLTWKGRGAQLINGLVEKAGGTLKEGDQNKLQRYAQFRSASARNLNTLLKELSGAAVTQQEFERLIMAEPNAGTGGWADFMSGFDSPTQFMSKLDASRQGAMLAIARANYLRQKDGLSTGELGKLAKAGTLEEIISLDGMKNVMNQQQTIIENRLRQQMRGAPEADIRNAVRDGMKRTFGI